MSFCNAADKLKRTLPKITGTMPTMTLREPEKYEIVKREQFCEIPPGVEYSLTEKGRALVTVVLELCKWGEEYL